MGHHGIDHAHGRSVVGGMVLAQKEDFSRLFLTDHFREVRRAVTTVEAGNIGVGLLEDRVLAARNGEVAHDVQTVSAANRPARHDGNDNLGHKADESLDFEDVQSARLGGVDRVGSVASCVLIARFSPNSLISAGTKRPTAIFGRWPVPGE